MANRQRGHMRHLFQSPLRFHHRAIQRQAIPLAAWRLRQDTTSALLGFLKAIVSLDELAC